MAHLVRSDHPAMRGAPISTRVAQVGGALAVHNAHGLYESAERAADAGNFGVAVALAVLAIEEAAKGRALFGYGLALETGAPFALDDNQFRGLIYLNHPLRHPVAFWQGMSAVMHTAMLTGVVPDNVDERAQLDADLQASELATNCEPAKAAWLVCRLSTRR